jgi:hypothetical protein
LISRFTPPFDYYLIPPRGIFFFFFFFFTNLLMMAALPLVSDVRLTDRRSFPEWYAELKINSTFRNVWHLVDLNALNAPHLLSAEPPEPLTID